MRVGFARGVRFGAIAALLSLFVLVTAACSGPTLPNLSGSTTQNPTNTVTWQLSLAQPLSDVPTSYTISDREVQLREASGLHLDADSALGVLPGSPTPGPHPSLSLLIAGYTGPDTYHVDGMSSYVQFNSGTGHIWRYAAQSSCTVTVTSDVAAPKPAGEDPHDTIVYREAKGTFSCQSLQPLTPSDPEASVQDGTFDSLYHQR